MDCLTGCDLVLILAGSNRFDGARLPWVAAELYLKVKGDTKYL